MTNFIYDGSFLTTSPPWFNGIADGDFAGQERRWFQKWNRRASSTAAFDGDDVNLLHLAINAFAERKTEKISSVDLADDLAAHLSIAGDERHLQTVKLARRFKQLLIRPKDIRFGSKILKGYYLKDFIRARARLKKKISLA